jgi:hypothetical protein
MTDALDVDLHDAEFLVEIRLLTDLMVVAADAAEPLGQAEIDAILLGRR